MKKICFIYRFVKYYLTSKTKYRIHSPFVYDLITNVINDKSVYDDYKVIESIRKKLLKDNTEINITDLGSTEKRIYKNIIRNIARCSAESPKYDKLLYRLVRYFKPANILELGTSLGLSAIYQSLANPESKLVTIEGCEEIGRVAKRNFNKSGSINNIEIVIGNFDDVLPDVIKKTGSLDYMFFDGNHRKEPTIRYFEQCIPFTNNNSLFVFDDIYWSEEMQQAWDYIKKHPKVIITIDLFFVGLVFFRKELTKQDFKIRF